MIAQLRSQRGPAALTWRTAAPSAIAGALDTTAVVVVAMVALGLQPFKLRTEVFWRTI
jgi:hypothetical protein